MPRSEFLQQVVSRGYLHQCTDIEALDSLAATKPITAYIGFDATADSLHVGSLVSIMLLRRLQQTGHKPIVLMGGGTTKIGDPSFRDESRRLLNDAEIAGNIAGIRRVFGQFLSFGDGPTDAVMVNNADWLDGLSYIPFLRDYGRHFSVNRMLSFDSVKLRLEREQSLSFLEFNYMVMQGYDFVELNRRYDCVLQMGGTDQWGNITSGIELIRKLRQTSAHGLVCPLVTTASGVKFGKTEAGTVWLDPERTSPYELYQFWLHTDDRDTLHYLRAFTWLGREEIEALGREMAENPSAREAQRRLAREVTGAVHGPTELERAERASRVLFGESIEGLGSRELLEVFQEVPSSELARERLAGDGLPIADLLAESGLVSSKSEARRSIEQGGIYLNNRRVEDARASVSLDDAVDGELLVLRKGRRSYHLVRVAGTAGGGGER
jgi:tyrosyl-tRNA synthetase